MKVWLACRPHKFHYSSPSHSHPHPPSCLPYHLSLLSPPPCLSHPFPIPPLVSLNFPPFLPSFPLSPSLYFLPSSSFPPSPFSLTLPPPYLPFYLTLSLPSPITLLSPLSLSPLSPFPLALTPILSLSLLITCYINIIKYDFWCILRYKWFHFHACYHTYVYFSIISWKSNDNLKNTLN